MYPDIPCSIINNSIIIIIDTLQVTNAFNFRHRLRAPRLHQESQRPLGTGVSAAKMKFQDQLFSKFQDIFTVSKISTNTNLLHVT